MLVQSKYKNPYKEYLSRLFLIGEEGMKK